MRRYPDCEVNTVFMHYPLKTICMYICLLVKQCIVAKRYGDKLHQKRSRLDIENILSAKELSSIGISHQMTYYL